MGIKYSDEQTKKYYAFAEQSFSWKYIEKPILEKLLKPLVSSKKSVLDAGCGTGRSTKLLVNLGFMNENITATDISPHMLSIANQNMEYIKFIESDLVDLSFKKDSLDVIMSSMVLHYLSQEELSILFGKFYKWLKPDGCVVFVVAHPFRFPDDQKRYFEKTAKMEKTPWGTEIEYYPKTISDYLSTLIEKKFRITGIYEPQPLELGKTDNLQEFERYSKGPTRLAIKASKN